MLGFGNGKYKLHKETEELDLGNAVGGLFVTKNLTGPQFKIVGKAGLANIHTSGTSNLDSVNFDVLSAETKAEISNTFIGAGANIRLVGGNVSIFHFDVGAGVSTGIGIKDDSISTEIAGTGVTVGRKCEISLFGSKVGVDFGKLF